MGFKKDLPRRNTEEVHNPQVDMFIRNIVSDDRAVYLHIPAVSAGEAYGPNNWGDYFPEESLKRNYKTFYNAKVYRRHKNKDPRKSIGDVVFSTYNPKMRRVELVIKVYRDLAPDIAEKSDKGEPVGFSMGCRVPYEVCSICSKKVFKTSDRCDHMKHSMNEEVDGKLCYAINSDPDFFDISETPNPADKAIWSIKKVASEDIQEDLHISELSEDEIIQGFLSSSSLYFKPRETLFKRASEYTLNKYSSLNEAMASSLLNGFILTPDEFQYIALSEESEKIASRMYRNGTSFENLDRFLDKSIYDLDEVADGIISILEKTATGETAQEAVTHDLLSRNPFRAGEAAIKSMLSQAGEELTNVSKIPENKGDDLSQFPDVLNLLLRAGLLYGGYRLAAAKIPIESIKKILQSQPANIIGAIGGYELAKKTLQGEKVASYYDIDKYAGWLKHGLVGLGGSYLLSSEAFRKVHRGEKVPTPLKFVAENPLISAIGLGAASFKGGKLLSKLGKSGVKKTASENEVKLDRTESWVKYNNLRDIFSDTTVVGDPEILSLADEHFRSVGELFR